MPQIILLLLLLLPCFALHAQEISQRTYYLVGMDHVRKLEISHDTLFTYKFLYNFEWHLAREETYRILSLKEGKDYMLLKLYPGGISKTSPPLSSVRNYSFALFKKLDAYRISYIPDSKKYTI